MSPRSAPTSTTTYSMFGNIKLAPCNISGSAPSASSFKSLIFFLSNTWVLFLLTPKLRTISEDACKHAIQFIENQKYKIDLIVFIQPTSPIRDSNDFDMAIGLFIRKKWTKETRRKKWTKEIVLADAKKYNYRSEWRKANEPCYRAASRLNILSKATSHMPERKLKYK